MNKTSTHKITVTKEEFKKIRKGKQTVLIRLNDEKNKTIKPNNQIICLKGKIDRIKKKVKNTEYYTNIEELISSYNKKELGYKKKTPVKKEDLIKDFNEKDLKHYGLLAINLKPKKHIIRKTLLIIILILILFFSGHFIKNKINNFTAKRFNTKLNEMLNEKIEYIFIEINPSFALTIKNGKVNDVACINEDCISIYKDININGKNINESIDSLINLSKAKGFNTESGVKIKTTNDLNIDKKEYITIEHIDESSKNELINQIINNEEIKNSNNNYYINLWNKLKEDKDYDKIYSCKMNNNELECYIKEDFVINTTEFNENDDIIAGIKKLNEIKPNLEKIQNVLKKFGFDIRPDNEVPLFEIPAGRLFVHEGNLWLNGYDGTVKNVYFEGKIRCDLYKVYLKDINLLKPNNIPVTLELEDGEEPIYENQTKEDFNTFYYDNFTIKQIFKTTMFCEYYESENYGNWNQSLRVTYEKCDLSVQNCKEISEEEFKNYINS